METGGSIGHLMASLCAVPRVDQEDLEAQSEQGT